MKLKSLEIQGFKSFDNQTIINFDDHITGVVGPNGCGKSNIVDSIRWVMGEQSAKHLRGRAMEDVIFSGTQTRQPNSLAQVELTFLTDGEHVPPQFSGCKEISVGRKLYRTGESEYFINRQPCRLKDITDFFLGTGVGTKAYSIIEQGRVGQIVMAKPEERRGIIEEAAGISKFKARKDAAMRKMESTRVNLSRLHDILQEIERQQVTLERQAKKAEKFKVVKDELMDLDLKVASMSFEKLDIKQRELLQALKELDALEQETQITLSEGETWIEEERLKLVEVEAELNDLQQSVFEWDNHLKLLESRIQTRKDDIVRFESDSRDLEQQIDELNSKSEMSLASLTEVNQNLAAAELECEDLDQSVATQQEELISMQTSSQELFSTLEATRETFNEASRNLSTINTRTENMRERVAEIEIKEQADQQELTDLTDKSESIEKLLKETQTDLNEIRQLKLSMGERTETLADTLRTEEDKVQHERRELGRIKEELLQKKSRLQSLEELERNFEGYQEGPRQILQKKKTGELAGVLESVADIIEPNSNYENAISAVLGERMQYLVVQSYSDGLQCAEMLKSEQSGRSSFIPVSMPMAAPVSVREVAAGQSVAMMQNLGAGVNVFTENYLNADAAANDDLNFTFSADSRFPAANGGDQAQALGFKGVMGQLKQFVSLKSGYENLQEVLFGEVLLVDNLKNAVDAWLGSRCPVVTCEGELISADGTLTGGTLENTSKAMLAKKREIKELTEIVQELVNQVKNREEVCFDLEKKIKTLKVEIDDLRSNSHEEDLRLAKQEKDILHYSRELENINQRRGKLSQQIYAANETKDDLLAQLTEFQHQEIEYQQVFEETRTIIENKKAEEEQCRQELARRQEELTRGKIALAQSREKKSFLTKEVDRLVSERVRLSLDLIASEEALALNRKSIIFAEDRLAYLEKLINKVIDNKTIADEKYHIKKDEFETINAAVMDRESRVKEWRREYNQLKDNLNQTTITLTEIRSSLARLNEQVMERYQLVLSDVFEAHKPDAETFDLASSEERVHELRQKLAGIGSVNLAAIDELKEINDRFEFLNKQKTDLEESLDALDKAIQKINRTTRERFKTTFELVNDKFTKLFPRLFKGGHAYLQLTDPENILETGVEIIAQPPGKKLQSISLLSGGEKALTAVSLLFAIFLIKPSPFCLLDEVDAPLDDANVDRYNEIVKEMSQRTQFMVITHNKRTMQVTDCLFGVTMQEPGVSQLVSVQMS